MNSSWKKCKENARQYIGYDLYNFFDLRIPILSSVLGTLSLFLLLPIDHQIFCEINIIDRDTTISRIYIVTTSILNMDITKHDISMQE